MQIRNKEITWLSFNARLLQEAENPDVPLLERLRFLGIFSSNLDEFFRVRVATLKRLTKLGDKAKSLIGDDPRKVLKKIKRTIKQQQERFDAIYDEIRTALEREGVFIVDETHLTQEQSASVRSYFEQHVRPTLMPVMLNQVDSPPHLHDHEIYLAVCLWQTGTKKPQHALIRIPTNVLPRFVRLESIDRKQHIILLDDVIRHSLLEIFQTLGVVRAAAYTLKLTRDAELDIEDDARESYTRKLARSLEKRRDGTPVRLVYDGTMPEATLRFLLRKLNLNRSESDLLPGRRYHNFKDFMDFPKVGRADLRYKRHTPFPHPRLAHSAGVMRHIEKGDVLLHFPYHSFGHVIDLLREASIDPTVEAIHVTLYRIAEHANVINALINAAQNGKTVTAVVELQARFDEQANLRWADHLQREGVRVLQGVRGFKVHAKLIMITRRFKKKTLRYTAIGTGNFHEQTARLYSDHLLLTADKRITSEVKRIFDFLENNFRTASFRHLLVSPFNARRRLNRMISQEIKNVKKGEPASIVIKVNNVTDPELIERLYEASQAGVFVCLMVRGMFSPIIGVKGLSHRIDATGIVDRFLEHTRIMRFENGGDPLMFLTSADLMPRNMNRRIEVAVPILDDSVRSEFNQFLEYHRRDASKARLLRGRLHNKIRTEVRGRPVRAQEAIRSWLRNASRSADEAAKSLRTTEVPDHE